MFSPSMAWLSSRALILGICLSFVTGGAALQAQSAVLVVDAFNKKVHVAADAQSKRPVGGLAKIATAMVTLDWAEASKVGVGVLATVPAYAFQMTGASSIGLQAGDQVTLRDLTHATMMSSDDVAAMPQCTPPRAVPSPTRWLQRTAPVLASSAQAWPDF